MKKMSTQCLFAVAILASAAASRVKNAVIVPPCDLECENGGYCIIADGSSEQLAKQVQSGKLIEVCVCRPGFTGVICENILEECAWPEQKCHNGAPCSQDKDGKWECDCSHADFISEFAGQMCRKPITEYCSGRFEKGSALSFCTNGGRCLSVAPGNTSANQQYKHMGCKCPPEFYGPHCEFLSESLSSVRRGSQQPDEIQNPVTALAVFILSMGLMILAILYRCKQRFQIDETSQHSTQADNSVSTLSDWEAGKNNMTVSMAQAQVLSCDQSER